MQIQLKQAEIIAALKQYITSQGINLTGKTVDIEFTAGRKESGLTADISIEETPAIPGFDTNTEAVAAPTAVEEPPAERAAVEEPAATEAKPSLFS